LEFGFSDGFCVFAGFLQNIAIYYIKLYYLIIRLFCVFGWNNHHIQLRCKNKGGFM